jgi:hypothetical protein
MVLTWEYSRQDGEKLYIILHNLDLKYLNIEFCWHYNKYNLYKNYICVLKTCLSKDLLNLVHSPWPNICTVLEGSQFNFFGSLLSTKSYYAIFNQTTSNFVNLGGKFKARKLGGLPSHRPPEGIQMPEKIQLFFCYPTPLSWQWWV